MKQHKISWLNIPGYIPETWNPIIGCSKVSEGCQNCYAEKQAWIRAHNRLTPQYKNVVNEGKWNGKITISKTQFYKPRHWKKPRMIFVCSMGDLFHQSVSFNVIDDLFSLMASHPQHLFIVLTKRPERALNWFNHKDKSWRHEGMQGDERIRYYAYQNHGARIEFKDWKWPLQNVWIGVSAETQKEVNWRIPILLQIPAAKRFVSIEPMLGPINLKEYYFQKADGTYAFKGVPHADRTRWIDLLDWVIIGGESGPKARPMHPDWVRSVRDQCKAAGVPFFFKQWGEYLFMEETAQPPFYRIPTTGQEFDSHGINFYDPETGEPGKWRGYKFIEDLETPGGMYWHVGRNSAGDLLDGQLHHNWPELATRNSQPETQNS